MKKDSIFINISRGAIVKTKDLLKNDILKIIGPPSSISDFNKNKWFYIERKKSNQALLKLGKKKITNNNILILKFNNCDSLKDFG